MPSSSTTSNPNIRKGSVFKMTFLPVDGVKPKRPGEYDRTKYFVIIGVDNDRILVGSVLINSKINDKMYNRIADQQYRITQDDYDFLTKEESYIDCYSIKEISLEKVNREAEFIGIINENDFKEIKSLLHTSPVIAPATLKKFHIK